MTSIWGVNPLALAQLIAGEVLQDDSWDAAQALLEKAFQVKQELLFDGDGAQAPRLQLFQDLASAVHDPRRLADILQLPLVQQAIGHYGKETIERIIPYLVPVADAIFAAPGTAAPPDVAVLGTYEEIADYIVNEVSYLDPVQGLANDCYLISAMIALAWSRPSEWSERVRSTVHHSGASTTYEYAFYRGPDVRDPPFAVEPRVAVTANRTPAYAHSADRAEAWVPMFEKAFVMRQCECAPNDPQASDYRYISDNRLKPQTACRALAGGASHAVGCQTLGGTAPAATVGERCDARRVTREPTMAWTWDDVSMMKGLGWKTTGLVHNHAYAVLGIMSWKGGDHVVLRNPWDRNPLCASGYAIGTWKPGGGSSGVPEVELNRHGVFAIRADWFDKCFAQVGWVQR
jgi:hypothetical protein